MTDIRRLALPVPPFARGRPVNRSQSNPPGEDRQTEPCPANQATPRCACLGLRALLLEWTVACCKQLRRLICVHGSGLFGTIPRQRLLLGCDLPAGARERRTGRAKLLNVCHGRPGSIQSQEALLRAITIGAVRWCLTNKPLGISTQASARIHPRSDDLSPAMVTRMGKPELAEQFDWFSKKFEGQPSLLVSARPFRLLVMNIPVLAPIGPAG
jgi:hypothetical protein